MSNAEKVIMPVVHYDNNGHDHGHGHCHCIGCGNGGGSGHGIMAMTRASTVQTGASGQRLSGPRS